MDEVTLSEMIENVIVAAEAVREEAIVSQNPAAREFSLTVTKLEEAKMWAEKAETAVPVV